MKKLYWFSNYEGDNILNDFYGTYKEAVKYAKENKNQEDEIYINCDENIEGII